MAPMFCPSCGKQLLLAGQRFCAHCGGDLSMLVESPQPAPASPAAAASPPPPATSPLDAAGIARTPVSPSEEALPPQSASPTYPPLQRSPLPVSEVAEPGGDAPAPTSPMRSAAPQIPAALQRDRSRYWPFLLVGGLLLVVAVASVGYLLVSRAGTIHPQSLGLPSASLDPDAPAFPVPTGSTLLNASMEGSGTGAYRLVAWQSGADYATTAAFYTGLKDARWQITGTPTNTPQATDVSVSDGSGVFASAQVEVDRTDPVRIEVRFLPITSLPAESFAPGATTAFGPLPSASALPDGFPSALVPAGTTLLDAGAIGTTDFALFSGSVDISAYETQIGSVVQITGTTTESRATVIDFTLGGKAGQIVVDPNSDQVSVEVTK
jgi:hypothetical protein